MRPSFKAQDTVTVVVGYDSIADPTVFGPSTIPTGGALTLTGTYSDPMISAARAAEFPWIFRWSCVLAAANGMAVQCVPRLITF